MCMCGGDRVLVQPQLHFVVHFRSGFLFRWTIISRGVLYKISAQYTRVFEGTEPDVAIVFVTAPYDNY